LVGLVSCGETNGAVTKLCDTCDHARIRHSVLEPGQDEFRPGPCRECDAFCTGFDQSTAWALLVRWLAVTPYGPAVLDRLLSQPQPPSLS
jgi:hypothetical protein